MSRFRLPPCAAIVLAAGLASAVAPAAAKAPTEHQVKAAFLYNFAKFVKWPDEPAPRPVFVIAVLGEDPFGPLLDRTFAGKTVLERSVEIRRIGAAEDARDARILFVGSSGHLTNLAKL